MRILVMGASGMLGNAMVRVFAQDPSHEVFGSVRTASTKRYFEQKLAKNIIPEVEVDNPDAITSLFNQTRPDVVVNCIGLVKQLEEANDPLHAISINALLPHRLSRECENIGARLVHFSTDCVFSGRKGNYAEADEPDAQDLYGRTKLLGEVDYPHATTLRTSIIGRELNTSHGLINWFLTKNGSVKGYTHAIFSGLPNCELARVVKEFVLPRHELHGLFHVAATPISKFDLLQLVNKEYGKGLCIEPDDQIKINRSLDATRFRETTGYVAPPWPQLLAQMHAFN